MNNQCKPKSIIEQMRENGMSDYEIDNFMREICIGEKEENKATTICKECKYFAEVYGNKICKKDNARFLDKTVTGCYGGEKW